MREITTTSRHELSSCFLFLQGKAPKEIYANLTETLACFLPGRAKDLSAPMYLYKCKLTLFPASFSFPSHFKFSSSLLLFLEKKKIREHIELRGMGQVLSPTVGHPNLLLPAQVLYPATIYCTWRLKLCGCCCSFLLNSKCLVTLQLWCITVRKQIWIW